ncbi:hypothetical protein EDB89DRAFT_1904735 [Lactarius sanguifluus]|nr:hypothetical protein EDB89DRAFT_1904735 [Lactarius sanguifluus]
MSSSSFELALPLWLNHGRHIAAAARCVVAVVGRAAVVFGTRCALAGVCHVHRRSFKFELHELTCQCSHDHDTSNSNSNEAIVATKATQPRPTTTTGQMPIDHNNGEMPVDSDNEAIPINLRRRGNSDGEHGGGDFIIQVVSYTSGRMYLQ